MEGGEGVGRAFSNHPAPCAEGDGKSDGDQRQGHDHDNCHLRHVSFLRVSRVKVVIKKSKMRHIQACSRCIE